MKILLTLRYRSALKKAVHIFLLAFYLFGTFLLPMGDFSSLTDLPSMYRHCKATEDKDLTPIDFITDHFVNIDGLFDKHDGDDHQKPHERRHIGEYNTQTVLFITTVLSFLSQVAAVESPLQVQPVRFSSSDYTFRIFHPPIM